MTAKRLLIYISLIAGLGLLMYSLAPGGDDEGTSQDRPRKARSPGARRPASGRVTMPVFSSAGGEVTTGAQVAVEGTVNDAHTFTPLADVKILFKSDQGNGSAMTDARGLYQLRLPTGVYEISLVSRTHVAAPQPRVLISADRPIRWLDFKMVHLATVAGRVVGPDARPLAGARVGVERVAGQGSAPGFGDPAMTDLRGRFSLELPPGQVTLRADAGRHGAALSSSLAVRPGEHLSGVTIQVGRGVSLTGQVLGPGGRRVSDASVRLKDDLGVRKLACDADGRFAAGGLAPGAKMLQASAAGHSPGKVSLVQLRPGKDLEVVLHVNLSRGVGGRVVDSAGQPVPGARVTVQTGSPGSRLLSLMPVQRTTTTSQGQFMLPGVPAMPLVVTARTRTNQVASRAGVAPGTMNVVLRLDDTGGITGRVTDGQAGKPLKDFTVSISGAKGTGSPFNAPAALRVVSPKGTFDLRDLVPGTYGLTITAPGYGPETTPGRAVIAGHFIQVNVVMNASGTLSGVVVDRRGAGVPGAAVRMESDRSGAPAITDSEGRFMLRDVSRGRRTLVATHPAYNTRLVTGVSVFPRKTTRVRVELSPRAGKGPGLVLSGIGAVIANRGDRLTVIKTISGSPAEVAGIRGGDVIGAINGRKTGGMTFSAAIEEIRGIIGTPVRMTLKRGERSFEVNVIRDEVTVPAND